MQGKGGAAVLVTEEGREWCRHHAADFMKACEENYTHATMSGGSPNYFAVMFKRGWFSKKRKIDVRRHKRTLER